jgi:4-hydroxybenzoate polyprenyltransferase
VQDEQCVQSLEEHPKAGCPLCVDLDGTLVKSDTLLDSVLVLARQHPSLLLHIPGWIGQGKAAFKQHITSSIQLDVEHLPYNRPLLEFLTAQHAAGRPIYLATAADGALARRVAAHLGIFTGVLASDGKLNLAGNNKLTAFRDIFGHHFSYIGNASPDAVLLAACQEPMIANPTAGLRAAMAKSGITAVRRFDDSGSPLRSWLKAIRLHQWAKNVLIFLPMLLAHVRSLGLFAAAIIAFLSFGLCASATYIVNDLLDLEADRKHIRKRERPFAAGELSSISGCLVVGLFLCASLALALALPHILAAISPAHALADPYSFAKWLGIYVVTTLAYSLKLKRIVLVDVIILSGLYTVRIVAGSAATGVPVSTWLAGFSVFFFLSLAFVKRFAELESLRLRDKIPANGRGYLVSDLEQLRSFGTATGLASVVVFTQYISNLELKLYRHPARLWFMVPVLLLWLLQLWLLASRGQLDEDPVVYAITDKRSLLLGVLVAAVVLAAL